MTDSEKTVRALFCAFNQLTAARGTMDAWNFFPTADFDTGSNLCRTMQAGVEAIKRDESLGVCALIERAARAMLRCSKGASGAILAAFFKGFSDEITARGALRSDVLPAALERAYDRAVLLLPDPVTAGTMLGLLRDGIAALNEGAPKTLSEAWLCLAQAANRSLKQNDAPPDPGALGVALVFGGVSGFLNDETSPRVLLMPAVSPACDAYAYAVQFTVLSKSQVPPQALERRLREFGEQVCVTQQADTLNASLKTNRPDRALTDALRFGALTNIAVQNTAFDARPY